MGLFINGNGYSLKEISAFDVDAMNTFTPLCPGELPVEGGDQIVGHLNAQAVYAGYRVGSKDAHSLAAIYNATEKHSQFTVIEDEPNADIRWNTHAVPGTFGFLLLKGLPKVTEYDYFIWKGIEPNLHPYGACYHDMTGKLSTGVIEWARSVGVKVFIVGGLATDYCVKLTVLQLRKAGFIVILNLAACRGITPETVAKAIEEMKSEGVIVIDSELALNEITKQ